MSNDLIVPIQPQRDENGYLVPGCEPQNPTGKNQWNSESLAAKRARVHKRLQMATLAHLSQPLCVETLSRNWAAALTCPDMAPHTARLASERVLPVSKIEQPDAPDLDSSADQWDALAEKAEAEVLGDVTVLECVDGGQDDEHS